MKHSIFIDPKRIGLTGWIAYAADTNYGTRRAGYDVLTCECGALSFDGCETMKALQTNGHALRMQAKASFRSGDKQTDEGVPA